MEELDLFSQPPTGEDLRDAGIKQAEDHANEHKEGWSDEAFAFLKEWITGCDTAFMAEDIRKASAIIVKDPPSARAWGSVVLRARKEGLITQVGFGKVLNPKAHCANAAIYRSNIKA